MRRFESIIICVLFLSVCFAVEKSAVASDYRQIMAIPEGQLLAIDNDPNYVPANPVSVSNEAIASLARVYKQTGEEKYARRLGVVLYHYSQEYNRRAAAGPSDKPVVIFDPVDEIEMVLLQAYLAIKGTASVKKLSGQTGIDITKMIEKDLIRAMSETVIKEHSRKMASSDPADRNEMIFPGYLADIALAGRALNDPYYIRVVFRYLNEYGIYRRSRDGEGLTFDLHSSAGQERHLKLCRRVRMIFEAIEGYSDPPGFVDEQGKRYDDISLDDFPRVQRILGVPGRYALPDGRINPIGDTAEQTICEPLEESKNDLLAGLGHAVLGAGSGFDQSQVQLHFAGQGGENDHHDCLSLIWYAHGRLMSGEIGRRGSKLNDWASSTLSHNTVMIDGQEQKADDSFGNVLLNVSDIDGLAVIQVDGARAYRHAGVKTYRRTIVHNTIDQKRPYFIDVFEIEGGRIHDYSVHGSVSGDMTGECSLEMQRIDGKLKSGEKNAGFSSGIYGFVRKVGRAAAEDDFSVTFAYVDDKEIGTRIHMLADPSMEVFVGESPGRFADKLRDGEVYERNMPHLIARRTGEKGLRSVFVAVYDMFNGGAKIRSVKRVSSLDAFLSLEIDLDGRVDKFFYSPGGKRGMIGGGVQMKGRIGLVTESDEWCQGYLVDGTVLRKSPMMVRIRKESFEGRVLEDLVGDDGQSNAFTVDRILPTGNELSGKWMIVALRAVEGIKAEGSKEQEARFVRRAYEIDRVERQGVKMVVYVKGEHGLVIAGDKTRELLADWREFETPVGFEIRKSAVSVPRKLR